MNSGFPAYNTRKSTASNNLNLNSNRIAKIKDRARRLSETDKPDKTTPKKGKHKAITPGSQLTADEKCKQDIRRFMDNSVPSNSTMSTISEVLNEANTTLHQHFDENQEGRSMTTPITTDQGRQGLATENEDEVTFKSHTQQQTTANLPRNKKKETEAQPDFDSMTNGEFMKILLATFKQHQDDTKETIESTLETYKRDISGQFTQHNQKVSELENSITTIAQTCSQQHVKSNNELVQMKEELKCLSKIVTRQEKMLLERQNKDDENDVRSMKCNLVIRGVTEKKPENCIEIAKNFFKNIMKIEGDVHVQYAHRLGKNKNRPLLVHLKSPADKGRIYKNSKTLKDARNENNQKYKIRDQLPARHEAMESRNRDLLWQNQKKKSTADDLQMSITRKQLTVNNTTYRKLVEPPTAGTILLSSKEDKIRWNKVKIIPANVILKGKCRFHGFSVIAGKVDMIRDAYNKLRWDHADARHIVCCYRLPGRSFHLLSDFTDDDEHGMGQTLLHMLMEAQIYNRAVFVVRYYGGEHLGPSRFQAYLDAAQSAIIHDPYNYICKFNQTPWPKEMSANDLPREEQNTQQNQDHGLTSKDNGARESLQQQFRAQQGSELLAAPEAMSMTTDAREGSPVQTPAVADTEYSVTLEQRDRLPSGPVRPLTYLHNKHHTADGWNEYYQTESYKLGQRNWSDGTELHSQIPMLAANITELTNTLASAP